MTSADQLHVSWARYRGSGASETMLYIHGRKKLMLHLQLYDHLSRGWLAVSLFDAGLVVLCTLVTVCFFGDPTALRTLLTRLRARRRLSERKREAAAA